MPSESRGRVLVSKIGLDGHDVGARVIARVLRDAGFEVVYLGIRQTPESVVATARDEDVDLIGVSILSGAHHGLIERLIALLRDSDVQVPVVVGGVIPHNDRDALLELGVYAVIDASSSVEDVVLLMDRAIANG